MYLASDPVEKLAASECAMTSAAWSLGSVAALVVLAAAAGGSFSASTGLPVANTAAPGSEGLDTEAVRPRRGDMLAASPADFCFSERAVAPPPAVAVPPSAPSDGLEWLCAAVTPPASRGDEERKGGGVLPAAELLLQAFAPRPASPPPLLEVHAQLCEPVAPSLH